MGAEKSRGSRVKQMNENLRMGLRGFCAFLYQHTNATQKLSGSVSPYEMKSKPKAIFDFGNSHPTPLTNPLFTGYFLLTSNPTCQYSKTRAQISLSNT